MYIEARRGEIGCVEGQDRWMNGGREKGKGGGSKGLAIVSEAVADDG